MASTSEVYGKGIKVPFAEEDDVVLGPTTRSRWSYAASKMVDEFLALAYYHERSLPAVVFRLFNTVGPRQTGQYGMVVPRFVEQALRNEPITIYGDGNQSRCFCDVSDVVRALIALSAHPEAIGHVFNIGNTEEVSITQLADRIIKVTKSQSTLEYIPYSEAYAPGFEDMQRRVPDTRKIQALLGWTPQIKLDGIIERVAQHQRGA